ncbi:SPOR domain-containing protein [Nitrincola alkalilacustris]|uniref:SPOR domain-containing protein n=1 Tax=Nitrincola alkalilacustris TaxID=1571224 RepID=UPI00124E0E88|nr:SPOR domain-containing protein [Nitrincola alkalilacustris]
MQLQINNRQPLTVFLLAIFLCLPVTAQARDAETQYRKGQQHRLQASKPSEVALAESYLLKAARLGHLAAQTELGTLYYLDFPDSPRLDSAHYWWQTAARSGDPRAQHLLGLFYLNGQISGQEKGQPDLVRAHAWTSLAADADLPEALDTLRSLEEKLDSTQIQVARQFRESLPVMRQAVAARTQPRSVPTPSPVALSSSVARPSSPALTSPTAPLEEVSESVPAGYFVQSGALADATIAQRELQRIHARIDRNTHKGFVKPLNNANGRWLYRLLTGPFAERSEAANLCAELKDLGEDCFVVAEFPDTDT